MVLTTDQKNSLEYLKGFIDKPIDDENDQFALMTGFAGVGKTWLVPQIVKYYLERNEDNEVFAVAPTHKAVNVLREKGVGRYATLMTIHKLIGVSAVYDEDKKEFKKINAGKLEGPSLIIVDEASMIGESLFRDLAEMVLDTGSKAIFIGDPAQLPPVHETSSMVFNVANRTHLSEIVRVKNQNPIIEYVTSLRNSINEIACPFERKSASNEQGGIWFYDKYPAFEEKFLEYFKKFGSQETKVIAWTNAEVDRINQVVIEHLYPEQKDQYIIGAYLVARSPVLKFAAARDSEVVINTGEEMKILSVEPYMHNGVSMFRLDVETENGDFEIVALNRDYKHQWEKYINERARLAKESKDKKEAWKNFYLVKESVADVRYSFALTCHTCQGSTFRNVFVHEANILRNPTILECNQCRYTAYTRASHEVHAYS